MVHYKKSTVDVHNTQKKKCLAVPNLLQHHINAHYMKQLTTIQKFSASKIATKQNKTKLNKKQNNNMAWMHQID